MSFPDAPRHVEIRVGDRTVAAAEVTIAAGPEGTARTSLHAAAGLRRLVASTYQAASGAGAANMRELVAQMAALGDAARQAFAGHPDLLRILDPNSAQVPLRVQEIIVFVIVASVITSIVSPAFAAQFSK